MGAWCGARPRSALALRRLRPAARTRALLGVGEAAYGSVGLAIGARGSSRPRRATITGAFMAGGLFGAVAGVILGGSIAARFGWRGSFVAMAVSGWRWPRSTAPSSTTSEARRAPVPDRGRRRCGLTRRRSRGVDEPGATPRSCSCTSPAGSSSSSAGVALLLAALLLQPRLRPHERQRAAQVGASSRGDGCRMITWRHRHDRWTPHVGSRMGDRSRSRRSRWSCSAFVPPGSGPVQLLLLGLGGFLCAGTCRPGGRHRRQP